MKALDFGRADQDRESRSQGLEVPNRCYSMGFQIENDEMKFVLATPHLKQFVFESNKVEAMTIIKNKMVFATDDENLGAAINISVDGH